MDRADEIVRSSREGRLVGFFSGFGPPFTREPQATEGRMDHHGICRARWGTRCDGPHPFAFGPNRFEKREWACFLVGRL